MLYAAALLPVSLVPTLVGLSGTAYFWRRARARRRAARGWRSASRGRAANAPARALFLGSIIYLPLIWVAMIAGPLGTVTVHDLPGRQRHAQRLSGVLLLVGYVLIRARRIEQHRRCMIAAFTTSSLFLICYLVYHAQVGSVPFTRQGFVRPLYFTILITHVTLAADRAAAGHRHAVARAEGAVSRSIGAIARWTFPIWLYVSVTGVLVYVLLYQPTWLL